ncbi:MAG: AbrB/MazE/SpoVT family DNA-binding domain-containing protein [Sulfolobales archaeon]
MSESSGIMRRVIRIGEKSMGVTIPREWLNALGIDIGSLVKLSIVGNNIIISPVSETAAMVREISLDTKENLDTSDKLSKVIIASYLEGLDKIISFGDRMIIRKAFNEIFSKLPGVVLFESGKELEFRISVDENIMNVESIIKTMASSSLMMFELIDKYFETKDKSYLDQLFALDDDLDRLHFMGIRLIKRSYLMNPSDAGDLLIAIKSLEHVGDSLDRSAGMLQRIDINVKCISTAVEMLRTTRSYYENSLDSYYKRDVSRAITILNERPAYMDKLIDLVTKTSCASELSGILHEALNIISISAEISELTVSKFIREKLSKKPTE